MQKLHAVFSDPEVKAIEEALQTEFIWKQLRQGNEEMRDKVGKAW